MDEKTLIFGVSNILLQTMKEDEMFTYHYALNLPSSAGCQLVSTWSNRVKVGSHARTRVWLGLGIPTAEDRSC